MACEKLGTIVRFFSLFGRTCLRMLVAKFQDERAGARVQQLRACCGNRKGPPQGAARRPPEGRWKRCAASVMLCPRATPSRTWAPIWYATAVEVWSERGAAFSRKKKCFFCVRRLSSLALLVRRYLLTAQNYRRRLPRRIYPTVRRSQFRALPCVPRSGSGGADRARRGKTGCRSRDCPSPVPTTSRKPRNCTARLQRAKAHRTISERCGTAL